MINENRGSCGYSFAGNSLLGEYFTMLLVLISAFACVTCFAIHQSSITAIVAFSAAWVIFRAFGVAGHPVISLVINCGLIAFAASSTVAVDAIATVALRAITVLLSAVLWMDLTELHYRYFSDSDGRQKLRTFVFQHGLRIVWFGVIGFVFVNSLAFPMIAEWKFRIQPPPTDSVRQAMERLSLAEEAVFKLCESLAALFCFVLGTCVGSFLNVVIYRVPRKISVLVKPSHCPGCSEKISGQNNIPGIGWLKLKGCCENCGVSISSRYPTVELTAGLVFLLLYFVELISGGTNLPGRMPNSYAGVQWILFYTKWDLVALYVYHTLLLCTLFSWGMIRRDGLKVPVASIAFMLITFAGVPLIWPILTPLPGLAASESTTEAFLTLGLGITAALVAVFFLRLLQRVIGTTNIQDDISSWLLIGAALGWQAVAGIVFVYLICWLLLAIHVSFHQTAPTISSARSLPNSRSQYLVLTLAVLAHHCVWRTMFEALAG